VHQISPTPIQLSESDLARFWEKVDVSRGIDGCWLWTRSQDKDGYGKFRQGRLADFKQKQAHRISWTIAHGPIPEGLLVLHECDTPACVNPKHLRTGTHLENMADCDEKHRRCYEARGGPHSGAGNYNAKLTDDAVREIRVRAKTGELPRVIAQSFQVNRSTVQKVIAFKMWAHVVDTEQVAA
jgi:hypothetical protein